MNPHEYPNNCTRSQFRLSSVVLNPPTGASPTPSAQPISFDSNAMSQDSPAGIGSYANSFFDSTSTSLDTVPPAPPQQQSALALPRSSDLHSIRTPRQAVQMSQGLPLPYAGSLAEAEMLSRGSYARNEEEARVEELLDGPATFAERRSRLLALHIPGEVEGTAPEAELVGPNSTSVTIGPLGDCSRTSLAHCTDAPQSAVDAVTSTAEARTGALCNGAKPLITSCNTLPRSPSPPLPPMTLGRSAATSGFRTVESLSTIEMWLPLAPTQGGPLTSALSRVQRTSRSTSPQSTPDTVCVALPLHLQPPFHTETSPQVCASPCKRDTTATTSSSRVALGAEQEATTLMRFPVFKSAAVASSLDVSPCNSYNASVTPEPPHPESFKNTASSPTLHAERSSRRRSPNIKSPRIRPTSVAKPAAVQSLLPANRLDSSGLFPRLIWNSTPKALLSAQEEVPPSPHAPAAGRSSLRNALSSARPASTTLTTSPGVSSSALPSCLTSLEPLHPSAPSPGPTGAPRALRRRHHTAQFSLEVSCPRTRDVLVSSDLKLSAEENNEVKKLTLNGPRLPFPTTARNTGTLLGSRSQQPSQLNMHELSSSISSHELLTSSGIDGAMPDSVMLQTKSHAARERERRSMMQRIFREPKKGGRRIWVSVPSSETCSSSTTTSKKS
ncbi:hypothetical protein JKF63_03790 [Porcisia hertigi]|uniref:Uncharacterized protein n=1 Tax=Porcisia hertigi TaxID=2761500 RepID=A0A836L3N5_9TRYP|nr:hypothetical protein JKF63_03790 [Porcisia hertigi]